MAEEDRIRLLRTAVTWPGAPVHTLRWIAEELEDPGDRVWSERARRRATEKASRLAAPRPDMMNDLTKPTKRSGKQKRERPKKPETR